MDINSVRELKQQINKTILSPITDGEPLEMEMEAQPNIAPLPRHSFSLGIARKRREYRLAIRIQDPALQSSEQMESIRRLAKNEVDIRFVGHIRKLKAAPALQTKSRPLEIGCSIGHFRVSGGTLGAFVKSRLTGKMMVLSNNHILADENHGEHGDDIIQPGQADGGIDPTDKIATLCSFVPLNFRRRPNVVDCAVGVLDGNVAISTLVPGVGNLAGIRKHIDAHVLISKIGRTTGFTHGRITAIEVDNVPVEYGHGVAHFNGQIEIEGKGREAFSQDGDSGSLIFDRGLRAVALLFATSDDGGSNGKGLTYANHLPSVLTAMGADLII